MNDPTKRWWSLNFATPRWTAYRWLVRYVDGTADFALFTAKQDADQWCEMCNDSANEGERFEVVAVKR